VFPHLTTKECIASGSPPLVSPPHLPTALRRRLSMTMPGSLFPRSSSLQPESPPHDDDNRRVRFHPGVLSPPHSRRPNSDVSTPLRPKTIPSVKAAVQMFQVDADASILLPATSVSPGKGAGKVLHDAVNQGRGRTLSDDHEDESPLYISSSSHEKGKGRAHESSLDPGNTSGEIRVQGKERELLVAREEQRQKERRWERDKDDVEADSERRKDKEKIKALEDEIRRLKEEVRIFMASTSFVDRCIAVFSFQDVTTLSLSYLRHHLRRHHHQYRLLSVQLHPCRTRTLFLPLPVLPCGIQLLLSKLLSILQSSVVYLVPSAQVNQLWVFLLKRWQHS
jgi:hypothetical protein